MTKHVENLVTDLRDEVLERLRNRPVWLTLKEIEEKTGIPVGWMKQFGLGNINDPGVCRVQTLKAYLDSRIPK